MCSRSSRNLRRRAKRSLGNQSWLLRFPEKWFSAYFNQNLSFFPDSGIALRPQTVASRHRSTPNTPYFRGTYRIAGTLCERIAFVHYGLLPTGRDQPATRKGGQAAAGRNRHFNGGLSLDDAEGCPGT